MRRVVVTGLGMVTPALMATSPHPQLLSFFWPGQALRLIPWKGYCKTLQRPIWFHTRRKKPGLAYSRLNVGQQIGIIRPNTVPAENSIRYNSDSKIRPACSFRLRRTNNFRHRECRLWVMSVELIRNYFHLPNQAFALFKSGLVTGALKS